MEKRLWIRTAALAAVVALSPAFTLPAGGDSPAALTRAFDDLRVGDPQRLGPLTVLPLLGQAGSPELRLATLEQALARWWLEITEKDGGSVPEVLVTNRSDRVIFILGGEILSGARQDRIVREDLLLSPWRKRLAVPVYCVEEGRWQPKSRNFGSEKIFGTFKLRAKAQAGGQVLSVDLFGSPSLFRELWPKILKSTALASLQEAGGSGEGLSRQQATQQLQRLRRADFRARAALDLGILYSFTDQVRSAAALVHQDALMHLAVFAREAPSAEGTRMQHRE